MIRQLRHGLARRKRRLTMGAFVLIALALAAGVWAGGGAGFTKVTTSTSISTSGSGASTLAAGTDTATTGTVTVTAALNISFKDSGLGNPDGTVNVNGTVRQVSFFWECFNNGGNHPKATNKGVIEVGPIGPLSDTFQIDKNGSVTGTLGPFLASIDGSSFCPSGQQTQVYATFVDINLADDLLHTFHLDSVTTGTVTY
jgi:hypothetical protein